MSSKKVVSVGAALVDLLIEESDDFISKTGEPKGGMTLSELSKIETLINDSNNKESIAPGGSACNTIVGYSKLGGNGHFLGVCGQDELGKYYAEEISKAGVTSNLKTSNTETGRVLSVITPDAQRTMFTFLGASGELSPSHISVDDFKDASIVHIEGYLLFNETATREIIKCAKEAGAKISLDLASFQVVEVCKGLMEELLKDSVDIILANEDEAKAYTGKSEEESLDVFADMAEIAVVKLGKEGALIKKGNEKITVEADLVTAVDTTGAGDLWASGFLYGLTSGKSLEASGRLAAKVAAEVVSIIGAHIPNEGWDRIHKFKNEEL